MGIRGIVSLQDNTLTRLRISSGWSFTSRICDFLSTGNLWPPACRIPSLARNCVLYLKAELVLFISSVISSDFPGNSFSSAVLLSKYLCLFGSHLVQCLLICLEGFDLAPHRRDQIFKNPSWFPADKHMPSSNLSFHQPSNASCCIPLPVLLSHFKGSTYSPCFSSETL